MKKIIGLILFGIVTLFATEINSYKNIKNERINVFLKELDTQGKKIGFLLHQNKKSLALMESNFNKYLTEEVVGYQRAKVSKKSKILRLKDNQYISISNFSFYIYLYPSFIKMHDDGEYRYHFYRDNDVHVVMDHIAFDKKDISFELLSKINKG